VWNPGSGYMFVVNEQDKFELRQCSMFMLACKTFNAARGLM